MNSPESSSSSPDLAANFVKQAQQHLVEDYLPKIRKCLERLSEDEVWWRPNEHSNSVGNLILHLCGNVRQWVISGIGEEPDERIRDLEFRHREEIEKKELVIRLESTLAEALKVLESVGPEQLQIDRTIQIYRVNGMQAIFHVVEHFSYHTGQIVYLTKFLRDTDLEFYDL